MRTTGLTGSPGRTVSDISRVESHSVEVFAAYKQVPFCGLIFVGALNIPNFYYSITLHLDLEYSHHPTTKGSPKKEGTQTGETRTDGLYLSKAGLQTRGRHPWYSDGGLLAVLGWGGGKEWETSN